MSMKKGKTVTQLRQKYVQDGKSDKTSHCVINRRTFWFSLSQGPWVLDLSFATISTNLSVLDLEIGNSNDGREKVKRRPTLTKILKLYGQRETVRISVLPITLYCIFFDHSTITGLRFYWTEISVTLTGQDKLLRLTERATDWRYPLRIWSLKKEIFKTAWILYSCHWWL